MEISKRAKPLLGLRFGRLVVQKYAGLNKHNGAMWECLCDCGRTHVVSGLVLTSGKSRSCGCLDAEARARPKKYRGKAPNNRFWKARQHFQATLTEMAAVTGINDETLRRLEDETSRVWSREVREKWNRAMAKLGTPQFLIPGRMARIGNHTHSVEARQCQNPACGRTFDYILAGSSEGKFCSRQCAATTMARPVYLLCAARCGRVVTTSPSRLARPERGKPRERFFCSACKALPEAKSRAWKLSHPVSVKITSDQRDQIERRRAYPGAPLSWAEIEQVLNPKPEVRRQLRDETRAIREIVKTQKGNKP